MNVEREPGTENPESETIPTRLAPFYSRFRVAERVLLTGHSHQAWPDVGFAAQQRAWLDAAALLDGKWELAETEAGHVREGFARLLGDVPANIALGQNTHELVIRCLSALPWHTRRRLVTTDGEFHTIRRQIDRLAEDGVEVVRVPARPVDDLARRLAVAVDARTLAVLVSSVLFETAEIVPGLDRVAHACDREGAALLVDAYHHLNVVPFDLRAMGLDDAFVTGGGYKYCQLGEGNCFLRVPPGRRWRPLLTGWFAEFGALEERTGSHPVTYARDATAFAGATYDPTSHYRAAAVFAFHVQQGLTPERLRGINVRQVALLESAFLALALDPAVARLEPVPPERRGGFLAVRMADAARIAARLRERLVWADARGSRLRLGPAPYVTDTQLRDGISALGEMLTSP
jgi:kynureninase